MNQKAQQFRVQVDLVLAAIREDPSIGSEELEPMLLSILNFVKDNPEDRELFVSLFLQMLRGQIKSPHEVIEFCMRELQWPEILEEINVLMTKWSDPRSISVLKLLSRVYLDNWEDSDLYAYYRTEMEDC